MKRTLLFVGLLCCTTFSLLAQNITVSGVVKASDDPYPLTGVNVTVKGSTNGTITDLDGNYTLNVNSGDVLVFSYMGYQTAERTVNGAVIDLVMDPDNMQLDE